MGKLREKRIKEASSMSTGWPLCLSDQGPHSQSPQSVLPCKTPFLTIFLLEGALYSAHVHMEPSACPLSGVPGTGGTAVHAYRMSVYVYIHAYVCVCNWETRGSRGRLLGNPSVEGLCGCHVHRQSVLCAGVPPGVRTRSSFQLGLASVRLLDSQPRTYTLLLPFSFIIIFF